MRDNAQSGPNGILLYHYAHKIAGFVECLCWNSKPIRTEYLIIKSSVKELQK